MDYFGTERQDRGRRRYKCRISSSRWLPGGRLWLFVKLQPSRKADDFSGWVNRGDYGVAIRDELTIECNFIMVVYSNPLRPCNGCFHSQYVIVFCTNVIVALDFFYDQHDTLGFEFSVGQARRSEHLHSGNFEVIEVITVMDAPLPVRFLITDTNGDFMFAGNDWE